MRFIGLVRHEMARIASRRLVFVMLAAFIGLMAVAAIDDGSVAATSGGQVAIPAASRLVSALASASGFAFLWAFALGGTVAEDRSTGSLAMILTRGGSRSAWLMSKFVALAATSAALSVVMTLVATVIAYSHGDRTLDSFSLTVLLEPDLAARSPYLYLLFVAPLPWLTVLGFCAVSIVGGLHTQSALASQALAAAVWALSLFAGGRYGPASQAEALSSHVPTATIGFTMAYWLVFIAAVMSLGLVTSLVRGEV